jgi:hypothetical protein
VDRDGLAAIRELENSGGMSVPSNKTAAIVPCRSPRFFGYFTAIGLIGEPTAPVIGSGGPQNRNS